MTTILGEPKLSTMVVLYSHPMLLDTDVLVREMPINDAVIKIEKKGVLRRGESKRDRIHRRNPKPTTTSGFGHNSVTLVLMNDGFGRHPRKEITIKIFHNGVFHLTGIRHEEYEESAIQEMFAIMKALPDSCYKERPVTWIDPTRRVVLMNFTTAFTPLHEVSRRQFQLFFQRLGIRADFEPDVDPAVKIRFAETWTARIFRTGKVNLTALKTREECAEFLRRLEIHFTEYYTSRATLQA
jgi:TATA-box binding protein (TBP) (component of TFIID and TFIIIB)